MKYVPGAEGLKTREEELLKKIAEQEAEIERRDAVVIKMAEKYPIEKDDFAEEIERDVDSYTVTQENTEPKKINGPSRTMPCSGS